MSIERLTLGLDYRFRDAGLLTDALTHRSHGSRNNERLEYLGDGLLNFIIGAELYRICPREDEGALSRLRASLVCEDSLARVARDLQLGELIRFGESEMKSGGHRRDSILADALEALMGAIYLDGGFEAARTVCLHLFTQPLAQLPDPESLKDAKTRLQEWLQGRARPLPIYQVLSESGPPHRRHFVVRCTLADGPQSSEAHGNSRRAAEQQAAEDLLRSLHA